MQCRDQYSETLAAELVTGNWANVIRGRLLAFVDFRDADSHSEVEKRDRLPWWDRLMLEATKGKTSLPKVIQTVEGVVEWVRGSIAPSLAVIMTAFQGDLGKLVGIIDQGRTRMRPRHHAMVAAYAR